MDEITRRHLAQRIAILLPDVATACVAILSGIFLFNASIFENLVTFILILGLDQLRAVLVASLLMTMGAALLGTFLWRRKWVALLGATAVFSVNYLYGFIHLELQPVYDPGRNLEPLNMGNLIHTGSIMLALALLCAFVGSAIGGALSEIVFTPFVSLVQLLKNRHKDISMHNTLLLPRQAVAPSRVQVVSASIRSWTAVVGMIVIVLLAGSSGNLFIFSPDVGLHSFPVLHSHAGNGPVHGTIIQDNIVSRALGGKEKPFLVYLPPSYNTPAGRTRHYPTLYLLHGSPGKEIDWLVGGKADQSVDTLLALGKIPELILVLPDGNGRPGAASEWGNSFDRRQQIETYIAVDLVNYVDHKYRTIPNASFRGIGGLSMGGFGAMNIAVHSPTIFGLVISLGGYYRAEGSIWGNNRPYMQANSPLYVLPSAKSTWHLRMFIGGATNDQPYYADAKEFVQELAKLHLTYSFDIQKGSHAWHVWQIQLYNALLWLHWG
ncbi:MAG: hypothetical protein PVS3B3_19850 [Ktedonobacteraceae bacterium]